MGRPRKPTRLHVLEGTDRPDRDNPAEPKPDPAPKREEPPSWLSKGARPWWRRIRPILVRMQVLTSADTVALGLLCDALAFYVEARARMLDEGMTPELIRATDVWWHRSKVMLTEFGKTPAARAKVSAADAGPVDPLESWESEAAP